MSFSSEVKREIIENRIKRADDALALLSAFTLGNGSIVFSAKTRSWGMRFVSENEATILLISKLAERYYGVECEVSRVEHERLSAVYHELHMYGEKLEGYMLDTGFLSLDVMGSPCFRIKVPCERITTETQKKAFLRGLFLACGTVAEPKTAYRAEFVVKHEEVMDFAVSVMQEFNIKYSTAKRRNSKVLYIKDGDSLENLLALLGASSAMMEVSEIRIVKQANNEANRGVNCITANISRSARTSLKQVESIEIIRKTMGLDKLPQSLRIVAEARLNNRDLTLNELSEELQMGKAAVHYRLSKLSEIAEELKNDNTPKRLY